jgi:ABC-2 type transport system permease protein
MSKVWAVAWREFKQTVLRKIFLFALIGMPVLIVVAMVLIVFMVETQEQPPLEGTVAIVDSSGEVIAAARREFDPATIKRERQRQAEDVAKAGQEMLERGQMTMPTDATRFDMGMGSGEVNVVLEQHARTNEATLGSLKERVLERDLLAVAVFPPPVLDNPDPGSPSGEGSKIELYVADGLDADHISFIERQLGSAVVRVRTARAGLDVDEALAMMRAPGSETKRVLADGAEAEEKKGLREIKSQLIPVVFMMLLWGAVITSSQHLMMSTIEEKSNRVMEVLLSALSPFQLIAGKILGHGGVGLLIVVVYSSLGIAALIAASWTNLIDALDLVYLGVFFIMAYLMIASIMTAVGSAVSDLREANTLITPVMIVVMIPLILWMPISQAPNGGLAVAFSFIPPAIPFVMILRVTADEAVPAWQIPATILWGYACVLGMIWMAAKIFRIGVLMYGKPPTPLQLLKWVRYS